MEFNSPHDISLRIKYESFAKFSTDLSKAQSFHDVSVSLQKNLKYIFNFTSYRILIFYESVNLQFEVTRRHSITTHDDITVIPELVAEALSTNISMVLNEQQLLERGEAVIALFRPPLTKNLCVYPIRAGAHHSLVIGAANKEDIAPSDYDYRFLRMVGESLLNKLSQLILNERLEQLVKSRTEQLNLANQELSTLFYKASHDFNGPLSTLLGLARLGQIRLNSPEELQQLLNKSYVVIYQAQAMLKKLKVISEVEALEARQEQLAIVPFLQDLVKQFSVSATAKNIDLTYSASGEVAVFFNREILTTVLENLITNAIQFHRVIPDAFIRIEIHVGSRLVINVIDNGQGIKEDQLRSIFQLYARANENSKGNGLGLYLVRKITEKLKGEISVESEFDKGSAFRISIPCA